MKFNEIEKYEQEIANLYKLGVRIKDLSVKYKIRPQLIEKILYRNKIIIIKNYKNHNSNFRTEEEVKNVINLYKNGLTINSIAEKLKVNRSCIYNLLTKFDAIEDKNRDVRKYPINDKFWDNFDENSLYFLGLMFTDGCVVKTSNTCFLSFKEEDEYILKKLSDLLSLDSKNKIPVKTKIQNNYKSVILNFTSEKIKKRLGELGCVPNKSLILKWPKFLENSSFMNHFIRGIFDGDGCVCDIKGWKRSSINIVSASKDFILGLDYFLKKNKIITSDRKIFEKSSSKNILYSLTIKKKEDVKNFYNYIYNNSNLFLKRKREKFIFYEKDI